MSSRHPLLLEIWRSRHVPPCSRPGVRDTPSFDSRHPSFFETWSSRHPSLFETLRSRPVLETSGVRDALHRSRPGFGDPLLDVQDLAFETHPSFETWRSSPAFPCVRDLLFKTHPCSRHPSWRKNRCPTQHALFETPRSRPSTACSRPGVRDTPLFETPFFVRDLAFETRFAVRDLWRSRPAIPMFETLSSRHTLVRDTLGCSRPGAPHSCPDVGELVFETPRRSRPGVRDPRPDVRHLVFETPLLFEAPFVVRDRAFETRVPYSRPCLRDAPLFETAFVVPDPVFETRVPMFETLSSRHTLVRDTLRCSRPGVRDPRPDVRDLVFETPHIVRDPVFETLFVVRDLAFETRIPIFKTPGLELRDGGLEHRVSNNEECLEHRVSNDGVSRTPGLEHWDGGLEHRVSNNEGCLEQRCVSKTMSRTWGRGSRTPGLEQQRLSRTRVCLEDEFETSHRSRPGVRDTLRCSRPGVRDPRPHVRDLVFETSFVVRDPVFETRKKV